MLAEAINYIQRAGSPIQRAQLVAWQNLQPLMPEAQALLLEGQRTGGGWAAFWSGAMPSVDATCYRMTQALAGAISPTNSEIRRGLRWLAERQSSDGTWEEAPELRDQAPFWACPGQQDATLYLTANAGWVLMRAGDTARATLAERFIRKHLTPDGRLPSFMQTHWLYAGLLLLMAKPEAGVALDMLAHAIPSFSAGQLVWMGNCLLDSRLPASHLLMQSSAARLWELQQPDGSWISDDSPMLTPQTTLEAIRFFLLRGQGMGG